MRFAFYDKLFQSKYLLIILIFLDLNLNLNKDLSIPKPLQGVKCVSPLRIVGIGFLKSMNHY